MAKQEDVIVQKGKVVEVLPNALFKVKLFETNIEILAHISGKMRTNRINILLHDVVTLEISPYDITKGRIIFRHK